MSKNNLCQKLAVTCHLMYFLRDQHFLGLNIFLGTKIVFGTNIFLTQNLLLDPILFNLPMLPTSNLINQTFNSNSKSFQAEHFRWLKENKKLEFDTEDQILFSFHFSHFLFLCFCVTSLKFIFNSRHVPVKNNVDLIKKEDEYDSFND